MKSNLYLSNIQPITSSLVFFSREKNVWIIHHFNVTNFWSSFSFDCHFPLAGQNIMPKIMDFVELEVFMVFMVSHTTF